MASLSLAVASIRLVVILCLTGSNLIALWKFVRTRTGGKFCNVNRLCLICTLLVNLFYISLVWTPFTIRAFDHYVNHNTDEPLPRNYAVTTLTEWTRETNRSATEFLPTAAGWSPKLEFDGSPKGTWSLVFPATRQSVSEGVATQTGTGTDVRVRRRLPSYIDVDCTFQDVVTSASIYSLAFITVIKLILTRKPIVLPNSALATSAYIFLLTGLPILITFAVRYGEQLGTNFAYHHPTRLSLGYNMYNLICDVHLDDNYVFLSFLEWAALIMTLLIAVAIILGVAARADEAGDHADQAPSWSGSSRQWLSEYPVYLATLWAWPLKPTCILVLYVMYGRHWLNTISWMSHLVVSVSTVFLLLAAFSSSPPKSLRGPGGDSPPAQQKKGSEDSEDEIPRRSPQVVVLPRDLLDLHKPTGPSGPSEQEECSPSSSPSPPPPYLPSTCSLPPSFPSPPPSSPSRAASDIRRSIPDWKSALIRFFRWGTAGGGDDRRLILRSEDPPGTSDV